MSAIGFSFFRRIVSQPFESMTIRLGASSSGGISQLA
jgi:hypothetical protein